MAEHPLDHEGEAESQQEAVEMIEVVEPPDHGPLQHHAEKSDDNRREDERPPVTEPGPLEEEVRDEGAIMYWAPWAKL